jgi:regulator of RNase E activity RraA
MAKDAIGARLERCYTGVLNDVMRAMGLRNFVLPPEIRLHDRSRPLAGPVQTVTGHVDEAADRHTTLLEWTGLLSKAKPGHVLVCQPHTRAVALMGELSAETLQHRGVLGYVVDGATRDLAFIEKIGFPIAYTHTTPKDIVSFWLVDALDVPIVIGEVRILPGDYLLADADGIVIVPNARAEEVVAEAERAIGTENLIRKAILAGEDPQRAYLKYGKF